MIYKYWSLCWCVFINSFNVENDCKCGFNCNCVDCVCYKWVIDLVVLVRWFFCEDMG